VDWGQVLGDALRAAVGVPACAYALAALGLNIHFGYTGLLNFGHVGFLLAGAYGTAISVIEWDLPLPLAFCVGVLAAVLLALLLGLPTLRLRAEYLAIVTISVAEILRITVRSKSFEEVTGGPSGIGGFAGSFFDANPIAPGRYGFWNVKFDANDVWVLVVGWGLVAVIAGVTALLVHSPWGRVLRAIREDEDAARSLGKNVFAYKMQSLVLGGAIGSFAGMLLVVRPNFVDPDLWRSVVTFFIYAALILGGPGRVLGPIVGSIVFWFVLQFTDSVLRQAVSPGSWAGGFIDQRDLGPIRFMLVGIALVLLMVFRPQGILGDRNEVLVGER
jgi:neutral amino acid transport system permease protein